MLKNLHKKHGISPVISVILLVAVTVALVTLATVIVFDIGSNTSDTADASVQLTETSTGVESSIIRNENVDKFRVEGPEDTKIIGGVGDTKSIDQGEGTYTIVAVLNDGSEEVLQTTEINTDGELVSGTAEYNPPAEGVEITSFDSEGEELGSDTTSTDGSFTILEGETYKVNNEFEVDLEPGEDNIILLGDIVSENNALDVVNDLLMNGDGSEENPFEIETASDLQSINEEPNRNYILVKPIDTSHTEEWDGGFEPIGSEEENIFGGSFDGQNNDITGTNIENNIIFDEINNEGSVENVDEDIINNEEIDDAAVEFDTDDGDLQGITEGDEIESNINVNLRDMDSVSVKIGLGDQDNVVDEFEVDESDSYSFNVETEEGDSIKEVITVTIFDEDENIDSHVKEIDISESEIETSASFSEESQDFDGEEFSVTEGESINGEVDINVGDEESVDVEVIVEDEEVGISESTVISDVTEDGIESFEIETEEGDGSTNIIDIRLVIEEELVDENPLRIEELEDATASFSEESQDFDGEEFVVTEGESINGEVDIDMRDEENVDIEVIVEDEEVEISQSTLISDVDEDGTESFEIETEEGDGSTNIITMELVIGEQLEDTVSLKIEES